MVSRRGYLAAVLVTAAMVVTACGRGSGDSGTKTAVTLAPGKASGTITMWAQGAEAQDLPALVKGFEKANPGVTVNITALPWADAHAKYQAAIAGGTTPDLAQMGTTWMADFAGAFDPVPAAVDTSGMFASAKAATVVRSAALGVPWYVDTRVIYYRTDLAKKAGYSTPPTTWAGFKAMARAMQTKAGAKWGINLAPGGTDSFQSALPFAWSAGASLVNSAGTKWTLDTPQMIAAMKYYQSFFTEGIADPNVSTAIGAEESAFVNGSTPILIAAPAEVGALDQAGGPGFSGKYAVMRFPAQQSSTSFIGGSDLVVFHNSAHRAAAWKLVQWLSQASVQAGWYKTTGDLPAVISAWDEPGLKADPRLAVFKAQMADTESPPANTAWTQVSAAGDTQLERIVRSGTDPAAAMRALQSTADSIGTGN
jgi:multiple sugar transport system substrate-binding protein